MIRTEDMNQVATYWAPTGGNGFGGSLFGPPVEILCRWQATKTVTRNSVGHEVSGNHVVYPNQELKEKGYLVEGQSSAVDPRQVPGARQILSVSRSTDLDATEVLHRVTL